MRKSSFGESRTTLLDTIIFFLRVRRIKRYLHDCEIVVDMGCGYKAELLRWILKKFKVKKVIGVDLSINENLANENIELITEDLNNPLPIQNESADIVISTAVIEHLSYPSKHIQELYRILKPGGTLLMTTPSKLAKPVLEFMAFKLKIIDREEIEDHKNYFNAGELKKMLVTCNFKEDNIKAKTFLFGLNNIIYAKKYATTS